MTLNLFQKFIDLLTTKKQLWPVGTMTAEFLKSKASEWLEVLKTNPMVCLFLSYFISELNFSCSVSLNNLSTMLYVFVIKIIFRI